MSQDPYKISELITFKEKMTNPVILRDFKISLSD